MKVVNSGNNYIIYDNNLKTYDELPAQTYQVNFNPQAGFSLSKYDEIRIKEKIYGVHTEKVQKVLESFKLFERNLGVILSGDKGIGKSLFAKMLAIEGIKNNYPLIIVNQYFPGIADYLNSIQQEVIILFDEFDKTFYNEGKRDSMSDPQAEMLTLFDGLNQGKKLFVITCNKLHNLNDYLVNRPGRFHYHFRFDYPDAEEIRNYLKDNIPIFAHSEIEEVISFSQKVKINYDSLRAIAFELSLGNFFKDVIRDLNIVNLDKVNYIGALIFKDGSQIKLERGNPIGLDIFDSQTKKEFEFEDNNSNWHSIAFCPGDAIFDTSKNGLVIHDINCYIEWQDEKENHKELDYLLLQRKLDSNIHYVL